MGSREQNHYYLVEGPDLYLYVQGCPPARDLLFKSGIAFYGLPVQVGSRRTRISAHTRNSLLRSN